MFAEESDNEGEKEGAAKEATDSNLPKADKTEVIAARNEAKDEVDFGSWPILELKRFLMERNIDCSSVVEKHELVQKAQEATQSATQSRSYQAPDGFVYHPDSGYFYNAESGLYYDGPSRCFYDPRTTKWYDETWNELKPN